MPAADPLSDALQPSSGFPFDLHGPPAHVHRHSASAPRLPFPSGSSPVESTPTGPSSPVGTSTHYPYSAARVCTNAYYHPHNHNHHDYHHHVPPTPRHYTLKRRRRLTNAETEYLVQQFVKNERPTTAERDIFARELHLDKRTIQVWFQNRRAKMKKDEQIAKDYALDEDEDEDDVEGEEGDDGGDCGGEDGGEMTGNKVEMETNAGLGRCHSIRSLSSDWRSQQQQQPLDMASKLMELMEAPSAWIARGTASSSSTDTTTATHARVLADTPPSHGILYDPDLMPGIHWDDPFMAQLGPLDMPVHASPLSAGSTSTGFDELFTSKSSLSSTASTGGPQSNLSPAARVFTSREGNVAGVAMEVVGVVPKREDLAGFTTRSTSANGGGGRHGASKAHRARRGMPSLIPKHQRALTLVAVAKNTKVSKS
ncbi:hypothetical protein BGZ73_007456 [Actinomortierella ambigua]|nr:hypothetical protein BGZ73_007456 [Actinomortierella ambigua]